MNEQDALTWDQLADIYQKATGKKARVRPMHEVLDWAETRPDLILVDEEGYMFKVKP